MVIWIWELGGLRCSEPESEDILKVKRENMEHKIESLIHRCQKHGKERMTIRLTPPIDHRCGNAHFRSLVHLIWSFDDDSVLTDALVS